MHYFDTSVLVAYYCPEPISDRVEEIMLQSDQPAISRLTEVVGETGALDSFRMDTI